MANPSQPADRSQPTGAAGIMTLGDAISLALAASGGSGKAGGAWLSVAYALTRNRAIAPYWRDCRIDASLRRSPRLAQAVAVIAINWGASGEAAGAGADSDYWRRYWLARQSAEDSADGLRRKLYRRDRLRWRQCEARLARLAEARRSDATDLIPTDRRPD